MNTTVHLVCFTALTLLLLGFCQADIQIQIFEHDGRVIKTKNLVEKPTEITHERKQIDLSLINDISSIVLGFTKDTLIERASFINVFLTYSYKLAKLMFDTRNRYNRLVKEDPRHKLPSEYAGHSTNFLRALTTRFNADAAKEEELKKAEPKKSKKQMREERAKEEALRGAECKNAYDELEILLDDVTYLVDKSPVGFHVNWTSTTFDGQFVQDLGAKYMGVFRRNGYGGTITLFDKVIAYLSS